MIIIDNINYNNRKQQLTDEQKEMHLLRFLRRCLTSSSESLFSPLPLLSLSAPSSASSSSPSSMSPRKFPCSSWSSVFSSSSSSVSKKKKRLVFGPPTYHLLNTRSDLNNQYLTVFLHVSLGLFWLEVFLLKLLLWLLCLALDEVRHVCCCWRKGQTAVIKTKHEHRHLQINQPLPYKCNVFNIDTLKSLLYFPNTARWWKQVILKKNSSQV